MFGNNPQMADQLLNLVLSGKKIVTCQAVLPGGQVSWLANNQ